MAGRTMEAGTTPEAQTTEGQLIPSIIARFYIWAEEASVWQDQMYHWAKELPPEIKDSEGRAMADKVPKPPPRWP
jgi:hypothetical protein